MKKLNQLQQTKLETIQKYLTTDIGKDGLLLGDQDVTYISSLKKMYVNASGIVLTGFEYGNYGSGNTTTRIEPSEITAIYRAGLKNDEDFSIFVKNN